jgi:hypothetical protein
MIRAQRRSEQNPDRSDNKSIERSIQRVTGNATGCMGPGNKQTQKYKREGGHSLARI